MKTNFYLMAVVALAIGGTTANAATIDLAEIAFKIDDGAVTDTQWPPTIPDSAFPSGVNHAFFDNATGLGSISYTFTASGDHYFGAMLDHEIDQGTNTFFNETGAAHGSVATGQTWQIADPVNGPIYDNLKNGALSNGTSPFGPNDVSMALGWNFNLDTSLYSEAIVTLNASLAAPGKGFYLSQSDPQSAAAGDPNSTIYLWATLDKTDVNIKDVPEPSSVLLMGAGLVSLLVVRRKAKTQPR